MHIKPCGSGRLVRLLLVMSPLIQSCGCGSPKEKVPFRATVWQENVGERHTMLDDLKANHLAVGMSKERIVELLGAPDLDLDAPHGRDRLG